MVLAKVLDVLLVQQAIILVELVLQTYNKLCDSHLGTKEGPVATGQVCMVARPRRAPGESLSRGQVATSQRVVLGWSSGRRSPGFSRFLIFAHVVGLHLVVLELLVGQDDEFGGPDRGREQLQQQL